MANRFAQPLGLILVTALLMLLLLVPNLPLPLAIAAGLVLILILPGYILTTILFRSSEMDFLTRVAIIVSLSLGVTIVGGVIISLSPLGLTTQAWQLGLGGLSAAFLVVRIFQIAVQPQAESQPWRLALNLPPAYLTMFVAAGFVYILVLLAPQVADSYRPKATFTQFWLIPTDLETGHVKLGIANFEGRTVTYHVVLSTSKTPIAEWTDIVLAPRQTWQTDYVLSADSRQKFKVDAALFREQDSQPYRDAFINLNP